MFNWMDRLFAVVFRWRLRLNTDIEMKKKILRRIGLYLLLFLGLPLLLIGLWVAQPMWSQAHPSASRVRPERLREQVRVLSTEMAPRSYQ